MSKTIELRKELTRLFETKIDEVHFGIADDSALYPYLQYELDEIRNESGKSIIILEINILDYGTSTIALEILADEFQELLHKYYFINDKIQFSSYKLVKNIVQEEDKKIKRRRLTFEIQLYELGGE